MKPSRNPALDAALAQLLPALRLAEEGLLVRDDCPKRPLVLIIGSPRSGTTVLLQWLASSGLFAVPSNLISRFSSAPTVAAWVQRILTDPTLAFADQLSDLRPGPVRGRSTYGRTSGALAPNEFYHFWRRHLGVAEIEPVGAERLQTVDVGRMRAELAGLERVLDHPLAMKGLMVQYDLPWIAQALPTAVFVHVVRDVEANAASLLRARQDECGSIEQWWSARPTGSEDFSRASPERQVVEQVLLTVGAIDAVLSSMPDRRRVRVSYEQFCRDPQAVWVRLRECCAAQGEILPEYGEIRPWFALRPVADEVKGSSADLRNAIRAAVAERTAQPKG